MYGNGIGAFMMVMAVCTGSPAVLWDQSDIRGLRIRPLTNKLDGGMTCEGERMILQNLLMPSIKVSLNFTNQQNIHEESRAEQGGRRGNARNGL